MIVQTAAEKMAHGASRAWHWLWRTPTRLQIAVLDARDSRTRALQAKAGPTAAARLDQLRDFYERYNDLSEILCDAARYGPTTRLETNYSDVRKWMVSHYGPIRRFVVAYLRYDSADARQGLDLHGQSADAFEALFCASTLGEFLRADDGLMIARMSRTREALHLYGDHLRQLAARETACA